MFDKKIGNRSNEVGVALNNFEVRFGTRVQKEREERLTESKHTAGRIGEIMERLQKLETRKRAPPERQHPASSSRAKAHGCHPT